MKSRLYLLPFLIAILSGLSMRAQVVVLQHSATASVYYDLDSAMDAASAGDYLYLSGGTFRLHGHPTGTGDSVHFYKPLHLIGAGIHPDSTMVTGQTIIESYSSGTNLGQNINIGTAAGGSTFDGIYFAGQNTSFQDGSLIAVTGGHFIFTACAFNNFDFFPYGGGNTPLGPVNGEFHECLIKVGMSEAGAGTSVASFDRCILVQADQSLSASVSFTNCFMGQSVGAGTVTNCIVNTGGGSWVNPGTANYRNCIIVGANPNVTGGPTFTGCLFNINLVSQFVSAANPTSFDWANNYHLAAGSAGINFGTDGHDVGVYGTANPLKEGFVPYNPHYISATVPAATDASGNLNINIHVATQPY